jgi:hypothetical protein
VRRPPLVLLLVAALGAPGPARALVAPHVPNVATVLRVPIRRAVFQHWMLVAARSAQPKATIPAYPSRRWRALKAQTMQFLVSARWLEGEARLRGVRVGKAEALRMLRSTRRAAFPKPGSFQRFLARSAMTLADIVYRVRLDALSNRIRADVLRGIHGAKARQDALDAFVTGFQARWKARTVCARRYVIAECGRVVG